MPRSSGFPQEKDINSRSLQLPYELLHKVIIFTVADAVHSIGTTSTCHWEMNILVTFYCVSSAFRAIAKEVVCKAFDLHKKNFEADNDFRLLSTMRGMLAFLRDMGIRLRNRSEAFETDFSVPIGDSTLSPPPPRLICSYVQYLSSISLRKTAATASTGHTFQRIHADIVSILTQSLVLCKKVSPERISEHLYTGLLLELDLSHCGSELVQAFDELNDHAASMRILQPSVEEDGTGPVTAVRSLIHNSLAKVETTVQKYPHILFQKQPLAQLNLFQIPGVLIGIRSIASLEFSEDEYGLEDRIRAIKCLWLEHCPFFKNLQK